MATKFEPSFDAARVEQMRSLLRQSTLPELSVASADHAPQELGVDLEWLKDTKLKLENYDVRGLEETINQFKHFKAEIDGSSIHFIHERSTRPDAIPIILLHGWPGSFFDFHKVIKPLAHPEDPSLPAFHVVVPSLPGYGWSTLPRRKSFSVEDIARIFNSLMTEILGYKKYTGQGGDWGSHILRYIAHNHYQNAPLLHFNVLTALPPGLASYAPLLNHLPISSSLLSSIDQRIKEWGLTEDEVKALRRRLSFIATGSGYSAIQATKPATIGYAIGASPLSLLAYIGEKFLAWSDPSALDINDLLATVVIYYLTDSFSTSVMIYNQSAHIRASISTYEGAWGRMKSSIGFSAFPYEIGAYPKSWIARCANLVQHTTHSKGGHFPALDNPDALVGDVRSLVASHW